MMMWCLTEGSVLEELLEAEGVVLDCEVSFVLFLRYWGKQEIQFFLQVKVGILPLWPPEDACGSRSVGE